jgi:hypothetical protein
MAWSDCDVLEARQHHPTAPTPNLISGNLYGTTSLGGVAPGVAGFGRRLYGSTRKGTLLESVPPGVTTWTVPVVAADEGRAGDRCRLQVRARTSPASLLALFANSVGPRSERTSYSKSADEASIR